MNKNYVKLTAINKKFGDYPASYDVNFGVDKGSLVALLGPSGSGKTTILRMIAGLETADSGDIFINGERVNNKAAAKRGIGFVFQNYALFLYMTVFDNIAFGLEVAKWPKDKIKARISELLELTGLSGLEKRYPNQLSGGQKQRVAFARALAPNPHVLLLDEPFAAVDAKIRKELRTWLKDIIRKVGITSIFVTHDHEEAIEVADQIIVTNKGRVEQQGTPREIYRKPASQFVAQFIGESSVIKDVHLLKGFEGVDSSARAVIRPEYIKLYKSDEAVQYAVTVEEGVVVCTYFRGSYREITVDIKNIRLTTNRSLEKNSFAIGESVKVLIYRLYIFDDTTGEVRENKNLIKELAYNAGL